MIELLPHDVIDKIFSYLSLSDLLRSSLVNKRMKYFFDCVAENPNHLRFRKLFVFIDSRTDPEKNAEFCYPDSIEVKSLDFIKLPQFRKLFEQRLEFLAIYSQPASSENELEINYNYNEYFGVFKCLKYLEFNDSSKFVNQLKTQTLKQFKQELESAFKDQIEYSDKLLTVSNGKEASYLIEKDKIREIKVSRGFRQFIKLPNVKYLYLKRCLNEINISQYVGQFRTLKCLKLDCIGISKDLKEIFKIQADLEAKTGRTFTVLLKKQAIDRSILNMQLLEKIQCNLTCMGIQLVLESSISDFLSYAKQFDVLYDYVILLNYKSHLLGLRELARFKNLQALYISKPSLSEYEINAIKTSFRNIKDLQIVATKIDQSFYEEIADNFPLLKLLSITNCHLESFGFLNKLQKLKKIVINRSLTHR